MASEWTHKQEQLEKGPLAKLKVVAARTLFEAANVDLAIAEHSKKRICCAPRVSFGVADEVEKLSEQLLSYLKLVRASADKLEAITKGMPE